MGLEAKCNHLRKEVEEIFKKNPEIYCPYFQEKVVLNSDGFHHLRYSSRSERSKQEQILKFSLFPLAIPVIRQSGTVQEYRKGFIQIRKSGKDRLSLLKQAEYWAFIAIVGDPQIKIRVILRRVGDGKIIFWSIMPAVKLKNRDRLNIARSLAVSGIEDE